VKAVGLLGIVVLVESIAEQLVGWCVLEVALRILLAMRGG